VLTAKTISEPNRRRIKLAGSCDRTIRSGLN
jgi:hypothetical protein